MSVGARVVTIANITLGDIQRAALSEDGLLQVSLILRITKGEGNWNHPVTIEGDPEVRH